MSESDTLFDMPPGYPDLPGFKRAGTSSEAARAIEPTAGTLRASCLRVIQGRPSTADEVAAALGETVLAIRPRVCELAAKNLIVDSGTRRRNTSGRRAIVWRAV